MENKKTAKQQINANQCPVCNATQFVVDYKTGDVICMSCGAVVGTDGVLYPPPPSKTAYKPKKAPIAVYVKVKHGDKLKMKAHDIAKEAWRLVSAAGLPKICGEFAEFHSARVAAETSWISRKALAAALVYIAARKFKVAIMLKELLKHTDVDRSSFKRAYETVVKILGIKATPTDPAPFIAKLVQKLGLDGEVATEALRIVRGNGVVKSGRKPAIVAAAAVYAAVRKLGRRVTFKELVETAGVSPESVREVYRRLNL